MRACYLPLAGAAITATLFLGGCVSSRTDYALASPADQQSIDRLEAQAKLKDPYSAVVEKKVGNYDANGKLTSACFYINAKNVYGAYTGVQPTCEFL